MPFDYRLKPLVLRVLRESAGISAGDVAIALSLRSGHAVSIKTVQGIFKDLRRRGKIVPRGLRGEYVLSSLATPGEIAPRLPKAPKPILYSPEARAALARTVRAVMLPGETLRLGTIAKRAREHWQRMMHRTPFDRAELKIMLAEAAKRGRIVIETKTSGFKNPTESTFYTRRVNPVAEEIPGGI